MTLTLAITLIVLLDLALLAGAAYVMSHAAKLTPHQPGVTGNHWRLRCPDRFDHQSPPTRGARPRASRRRSTARGCGMGARA